MYQELAPLTFNREVMPGVFLMKIASPRLAAEARPGQFVMLSSDREQTRLLRRPISLHSVEQSELHLLYAVVGAGTRWLSERQPGEKLDILGPAGHGFTVAPDARRLLLVAGGMGIAPFRFLAAEAAGTGCHVTLLAGARSADLLLPPSSFPEGTEYRVATEDGSRGVKGLVTALLPEHSRTADQVFICGPLPMFRAIARDAGVLLSGKPTQVSLEVRMGCGMGICYSCTIRTTQGLKKVCQHGPVFDLQEVDWDWLK